MADNKKKIAIISGIIGGVVLLVVLLILILGNISKEFTISFDSMGGTTLQSIKVEDGKTFVKPTVPKRDGYVFVEWQLNGKTYDFSTPVTGDARLVAVWEEIDDGKVDVTFDSAGGNADLKQTIEKGSTINKPEDPVRENYKFLYWALDEEEFDFTTEISKDITLVAVWESKIEYTVKFELDGGTKISNMTVKGNEKLTKPADPTKKGYVFVEWQLDGEPYDFNAPVTQDITLKAIWKVEVKYTVTFNSDGGNTINSQSVVEGKKATLETPKKEGYVFVEWQLDGSKYDFNKTVTKDITLKAIWKVEVKYTVTFNSDGGNSIDNQTVIEGNKVTKPTNPKKEGYSFVEWQLDGSKYDFNKTVTKDITLKAIWKMNEFKVTMAQVDKYSPDLRVTVTENGKEVSFSKMLGGKATLCTGENPVVNPSDIERFSEVKIVLKSGTEVTAKIVK